MKTQFQIIGRTDDITHIETSDIRCHPSFPDTAASLKVSWSKNVLDERHCPDQFILGSMDDDFCVLISLATYMETKLSDTSTNHRYLFCDGEDDMAPKRLNQRYYRVLKSVWSNNEFQELCRQTRGRVGTHSMRKFPSTWCAEHGCTPFEIEVRGRWKQASGRVVNRYINPNQLPIDAKLAGILCVGGPVKYKLKDDSNVTDAFLATAVAPALHAFFNADESNHIPKLLSVSLLYAVHVPALAHMMSDLVRNRIRNAYNGIRGTHGPDYNPVKKVPLHIWNEANHVNIAEWPAANNDGGNDRGNGPVQLPLNQAADRHNIVSMMVQLAALQRLQTEHHLQHSVS